MTVPKQNIEQTKNFEEYPKILKSNETKFDGYIIYDRIIQKSAKTYDWESFMYFPKSGYSFGDKKDIEENLLDRKNSDFKNYIYRYIDSLKMVGRIDFFDYLIDKLRNYKNFNINTLKNLCVEFEKYVNSKAIFGVKDNYIVKETDSGFEFNNKMYSKYYKLIRGKLF